MYCITEKGIFRPFKPERDLIRLLKYGTYDLLELDDLWYDEIDKNELTYEEMELIAWWHMEYGGVMSDEEAFE